jgi:hypothetical protein
MNIELHILNLLLQKLLCNTVLSWETYILRWGFEVDNVCDTCAQSSRRDRNRNYLQILWSKGSK